MSARKKNTLVSITASTASIQLWSANVSQKSHCLEMAKVSVAAIDVLTMVSVTACKASIQLWSTYVGQKSHCLEMAKVSVTAIWRLMC
jgi:hypothetical protein